MKLAFVAAHTSLALLAKQELQKYYGHFEPAEADYLIALGGDGSVLHTLYSTLESKKPVYAMRRTESVGFLCNKYSVEKLPERIIAANGVVLHPLKSVCTDANGVHSESIAINEVALVRASPQSGKLRVIVDGIPRIEKYSGDGLLIATPAGSTGYNHSAGGPIIPLDANMLVMTAICGFRPRRWSHAVLPQNSVTEVEVIEHEKRPIRLESGIASTTNIVYAKIWQEKTIGFKLLFDPDQHLRERIIREQFSIEPV